MNAIFLSATLALLTMGHSGCLASQIEKKSSHLKMSVKDIQIITSHRINKKVAGYDDRTCCGAISWLTRTFVFPIESFSEEVVFKQLKDVDTILHDYHMHDHIGEIAKQNPFLANLIQSAGMCMESSRLTGSNIDQIYKGRLSVVFPHQNLLHKKFVTHLEQWAESKNCFPIIINQQLEAQLTKEIRLQGLSRVYLEGSDCPFVPETFAMSCDAQYISAFNRNNVKLFWKISRDENGCISIQNVAAKTVPQLMWNGMLKSNDAVEGRLVTYRGIVIHDAGLDVPYIKDTIDLNLLYCLSAWQNEPSPQNARALFGTKTFALLSSHKQEQLRSYIERKRK